MKYFTMTHNWENTRQQFHYPLIFSTAIKHGSKESQERKDNHQQSQKENKAAQVRQLTAKKKTQLAKPYNVYDWLS